jgi:hypothetical protein
MSRPTPEKELAPKPPLSATKQDERALQSDNIPGAEPEAELESCYVALWENIDDSATARRLEQKFKRLIHQVSDQRVREFAERVKADILDSHYIRLVDNPIDQARRDIDQVLADYLKAKEARDEA